MKRSSLALLAVAVATASGAACAKKVEQKLSIPTATVSLRTIVLDATASGSVEPINVVEVKSKSSGQITKMPVETGSQVAPGDLLVQLDTRDVQNQYDQAAADLNAAEAKLQVSEAQKKRSDDLFLQRIITAQENETARLDFANAQASVIRARTSLDLAKQRLEDATVRAPVEGTVIEKTVSLGQVITSATSAFGGGTTLLKMADLSKVRMRALFNETDIGSVQPGQQATVTVDAYPERPFRGTVEKIEPQAVVQQSVTMFPVLINLANNEGLLKPGMNGEASVLVDRRENVVAVPNDAVRTVREAPMLANQLGLNTDTVSAQIQAQMAQFGGMGAAGRGEGTPGGRMQVPREMRRMMPGEVDLAPFQGPQGARAQLPEVTDADCRRVSDAMKAKPEVAQQLAGLRQKLQGGEIDFATLRAESQKAYAALGVDAQVARACQARSGASGAPGGMPGGRTAGGATPAGGTRAGAAGAAMAQQQGNAAGGRRAQGSQGGAAVPQPRGEFPMRTRSRPGVVFVKNGATFDAKVVRLGLGNFDYTEVLSGLKDGDEVALLGAAAIQVARDSSNARFRQMTGGGMPGMQKQQGQQGQQGGAQGGGAPPRQ
ncbi:MAG: efflux RND transporter periplasmic adaptor subunit [Gemmatimonadaceae bacterium]|nr:efflux RND transporter periplasmic adaptor subunit [Gemmatimonadaceae bacterium]